MAQSVKLWFKKQLRLDHLTFRQREMYEIGEAGLASVKRRLAQARGPADSPAKPLGKGYAIMKARKLRKASRRDLSLTGAMLANLTLRTVSENSAKAALTAQKQRIKGWANMKKEPWLVFSPVNEQDVMKRFRQVVRERSQKLLIW